jgi:hypothetical protein
MIKRHIVSLGLLLLGVAVVSSTATSAEAASPAGGAIQVFGTPTNGGPVLITGAIADSGHAFTVNASGKAAKNGNYQLLKLKKGSILVNTTQLNQQFNSNSGPAPTAFNTTTCSGSFSISAPSPIVRGTKLYAGITGSASITVTFAGIFPLQNGKCNMGNNGPNPTAQYQTLSGTGTVSF